ncbi:hypothetical protein BDY21DRAFT_42961 [Lineolata rhizophorae]|uniref:DUF202 domain-containing protein n=1 Tax=Lineolata rhizophorae TaxID=578093 RepID=A0A6A6NZ40_9PEZI|nr:hypothetical protein BDY21DRAFT_42961 [Lineolata rhizophorae]
MQDQGPAGASIQHRPESAATSTRLRRSSYSSTSSSSSSPTTSALNDEPAAPDPPVAPNSGIRREPSAASAGARPAAKPTPWDRLKRQYGSVELDNKGSVARDHLALERTFLAWVRTSISFASIGVAITQLFRLNTTISKNDPSLDQTKLASVGKPLGATFVAIAVAILFIGFHRYFESQHYVIRGKFPASRGSIMLVAFGAGGLIVASMAVILAVGGTEFET